MLFRCRRALWLVWQSCIHQIMTWSCIVTIVHHVKHPTKDSKVLIRPVQKIYIFTWRLRHVLCLKRHVNISGWVFHVTLNGHNTTLKKLWGSEDATDLLWFEQPPTLLPKSAKVNLWIHFTPRNRLLYKHLLVIPSPRINATWTSNSKIECHYCLLKPD